MLPERLADTVAGLVLTATSYDDPAVRVLTAEVQAYYRRIYGGSDDSPLIPAEVSPPHGLFLLARIDGAAVGMGGWRTTEEGSALRVPGLDGDRPAELRRMFTVPSVRRTGVARALLTELERTAARAGADVMVLSTGRPQRAARAFYRACGYLAITPFGFYGSMPGVVCLGRRLTDRKSAENGKVPHAHAVDPVMTQTPSKIVYTASATVQGGRQGHATSSDGILDLDLTSPKETGGPGTGTNPEQLFAVGFSACFNGALMMVAKKAGVDASGAQVTANIGFGPEGDSFAITADLEVSIPGVNLEQAQELTDAAHQVCPYSKATRGNVPVTVKAVAA